jgi:hypothetical protein
MTIRPDIEAMARAMMAVSDRDGVTPVWDDEPEIAREAYRKLARAAATSLVAEPELARLREALKVLWVAFQDDDAFRRVYASLNIQQQALREERRD